MSTRRARARDRSARSGAHAVGQRAGERARRSGEHARAPHAVVALLADLHCADCDIHYAEPTPSLFSFNSPIGACETCRGFGRVIGVDYGLVIPDEAKTLRARRGQALADRRATASARTISRRCAKKRGIPLDVPWRDLPQRTASWVIEGDADWVSWSKTWPGSGTASSASSPGSRPRPTRCTSACCCRATARTRRARLQRRAAQARRAAVAARDKQDADRRSELRAFDRTVRFAMRARELPA